MHHGKHTEKVVYINLCPNTTIEPDENDQRFVVDAWIGGKFNLDIVKFLIGAAATVEMLGGPKIAKIIVPSSDSKNEVSKDMVRNTKSSGIGLGFIIGFLVGILIGLVVGRNHL
jgi:hypothetical protein